MFNRIMTDSVARNNVVSNEDRGIVVGDSSDNEIYNNRVSDSGSGIDVDEESTGNNIHNNTIVDIANPEDALRIDEDSGQNTFSSNTLLNSSSGSNVNLDELVAHPIDSDEDEDED